MRSHSSRAAVPPSSLPCGADARPTHSPAGRRLWQAKAEPVRASRQSRERTISVTSRKWSCSGRVPSALSPTSPSPATAATCCTPNPRSPRRTSTTTRSCAAPCAPAASSRRVCLLPKTCAASSGDWLPRRRTLSGPRSDAGRSRSLSLTRARTRPSPSGRSSRSCRRRCACPACRRLRRSTSLRTAPRPSAAASRRRGSPCTGSRRPSC